METLTTQRLSLRSFVIGDADVVARLANDKDVSQYTALLPYPYTLADAQAWLESHAGGEAEGRGRPWAITRREDGVVMGTVSLNLRTRDRLGILGYWLGQAYWGCGYATEAARECVRWGFAQGLVKVAADAYAVNKASIVVLERCELRLEGILRSHVERGGQRLDVHCYGRLSDDALNFK